MRLVKRVSFSDVNSGYIHVANVTTNSPTLISGVITVISSFIGHTVNFDLKYDPVTGTDKVVSIGSSNTPIGETSTASITIYTEVDGEISIQLTDNSSGVSTGDAVIIISVESIPVS